MGSGIRKVQEINDMGHNAPCTLSNLDLRGTLYVPITVFVCFTNSCNPHSCGISTFSISFSQKSSMRHGQIKSPKVTVLVSG